MNRRQFLAAFFGCILIYNVCKTKYHSDLFGALFGLLFVCSGIVFLIIALFKDAKQYRNERKIRSFTTTFILAGSALLAIAINYLVNYNFYKPTLTEAYYDGDYNGVGLDFKIDGTYVQDDMAVGSSNYTYGNYRINGDTILLRKALVQKLVFRKVEEDMFLVEIDSAGEEGTEFRVTQDNR